MDVRAEARIGVCDLQKDKRTMSQGMQVVLGSVYIDTCMFTYIYMLSVDVLIFIY